MWLVLCDPSDAAAFWAHQGLRARGLSPLELITSEDLASARWDHRVGDGQVSVELTLSDGRTVRHDRARGVLNRLLQPPREGMLMIHPSDREYVAQELTSFYMSWLSALPGPVLNRPTHEGLCGRMRYISEWCWLAMQAGLPTPVFRQSGDTPPSELAAHARIAPSFGAVTELATVLVVGRYVVGAPAPAPIADGCRRLAELSRSSLLGIEFSSSPEGEWQLAGVTVFPDLRLGGEPMLDALMRTLTELEETT